MHLQDEWVAYHSLYKCYVEQFSCLYILSSHIVQQRISSQSSEKIFLHNCQSFLSKEGV